MKKSKSTKELFDSNMRALKNSCSLRQLSGTQNSLIDTFRSSGIREKLEDAKRKNDQNKERTKSRKQHTKSRCQLDKR